MEKFSDKTKGMIDQEVFQSLKDALARTDILDSSNNAKDGLDLKNRFQRLFTINESKEYKDLTPAEADYINANLSEITELLATLEKSKK